MERKLSLPPQRLAPLTRYELQKHLNEAVDRSGSGRIVQIPIRGPVRNGTILSASAGDPPTATLIEWDNGGEEWIRDEDFGRLRIWLLTDERKDPPPTPLEDLLHALITQRRASGARSTRDPEEDPESPARRG